MSLKVNLFTRIKHKTVIFRADVTVPSPFQGLNFGMIAVRYEDSSWQCLTHQSPLLRRALFSVSWPRIASSIILSLLQHLCHVVFWSLESIPEIISASNTSTHLKFWWQKHQTMAFVQGSGTATLSPPKNIFFEESSRPTHKGRWPRLQKYKYIVQTAVDKVSWYLSFPPWNASLLK